jgi:hypothetical protein
MNIYFIVFIIVIPFTIFFITIFSDNQFKRRFNQLKTEINKPFNNLLQNKDIPTKKTNKIYSINDGIGFGFGKEFFSCKPQPASLTSKQKSQARNASIGIKFHKFKMNKRYNIPEIDDVVLKDYCSEKYLEKNFVNLINSAWAQTGIKFFIKDMIEEDESDNLSKYYNYSPNDNQIFPSCEDIVNFKENPVEFTDRIPPLNHPTQSTGITTSSIIDSETIPSTSSGGITTSSQQLAELPPVLTQSTQTPHLPSGETNFSFPILGTFIPDANTPDPSQSAGVEPSQSAGVETFVGQQLFDSLFNAKPVPEMAPKLSPEVSTPIPANIKRVRDSDIKKMTALDIYILKRILGKENILNQPDKKNIIRNIFFRMTDESQYINDRDLHIFLVPYIADDLAFLVEGRNNRPLLVVSMYQKDCNKMEKVIENVSTDKTCGPWLELLLGNYQQLRNSEREYNEIANIDFKLNPLNPCGPREIDASPQINAEITELRNQEIDLMEQLKTINKNSDIDKYRIYIEKNIKKIDKLYNYDYINDYDVKLLKNYKNRRKSVIVTVNGEPRHELHNYHQLRSDKIKELQKKNGDEIKILKSKNSQLSNSLKDIDAQVSQIESKLADIRSKINGKMIPKKSKVGTLQAVKKRIDTMTKEISAPMYYAEKTRNVLNINLILLIIFGQVNNKLINGVRLGEINKQDPICHILTKTIVDGGISLNKSRAVKESILDNRSNFSFLNLTADRNLRNVILGPDNDKNGLYKKHEANKCNILGFETIRLENATISSPKIFCENTEFYETSRLNALDLNAQYYFVNTLLEKVENKTITLKSNELASLQEFKRQIEYQCTGCRKKDYTNYRAEPTFIQSKEYPAFFSNEEALKNYEWLSRYIVKNRIDIKNTDFIFDDAEYLYNNSDIFTHELKTSFFPEETEVTDAINCPILDKPNQLFNIDPTTLNDYILKKSTCNKGYLNSFKDSFI